MGAVVVSVVEDREPWRSEVVEMFRSVRENGGNVADARCVCWTIGGTIPGLDALYVEQRPGAPVHPRLKWANRVQAFEEAPHADHVVYLASDVLVLRPFDHLLNSSIRGGRIARGRFRGQSWVWPTVTAAAGTRPRIHVPHVNDDILFVPGELATGLGVEWWKMLHRLRRHPLSAGLVYRKPWRASEYALAATIVRFGLPFELLPREAHHHAFFGAPDERTLIWHHHHQPTPSSIPRGISDDDDAAL